LGISLKKQQNADVSALGAAYLSGLKSGVYESIEQLQALNKLNTEEILPSPNNEMVLAGYQGWCERIGEF
jgi:glycerol kinase